MANNDDNGEDDKMGRGNLLAMLLLVLASSSLESMLASLSLHDCRQRQACLFVVVIQKSSLTKDDIALLTCDFVGKSVTMHE